MNHNNSVEKALISRLIDGDESAFSILFSAYYRDLVLFAFSFTKNCDDAEEIAQDTFVKLWEDHKILKVDNSLKSYLLKTVRNKCIDRYRHEKIKQIHADKILEIPPLPINDVDNYILYSELQEKLEISLKKLPDELSHVFRLNRNKGMKYKEIADLIGVSLRTVEERMAKALIILREELKEFFQTS